MTRSKSRSAITMYFAHLVVLTCAACRGQPASSSRSDPKSPAGGESRPAADSSEAPSITALRFWKTRYRYRLAARLDDREMNLAGDEGVTIDLVSLKNGNAVFEVANHRSAPVWFYGRSADGAQMRAAILDEGRWWKRPGLVREADLGLRTRFSFVELAPGASAETRCSVDPSVSEARFGVYFADHAHSDASACQCNYLDFRELWTLVIDLEAASRKH